MFLWRVLSGALAVAERLASRGLTVAATCRLCNTSIESINQVLYLCPMVQDFWQAAMITPPTRGFSDNIEENMWWAFDLMDFSSITIQLRGSIPWLLWSIWKNRNSIMFSQTHTSITSLVQETIEKAKRWRELNCGEDATSLHVCPGRIWDLKWQKPRQDIIKCNLNGNWRNSSLHCGGAWITRDHFGVVLFHAREAFTRAHNRNVAKFKCMIWTLQSLKDLHLTDVVISSDYQATHEALSKPYEWPRYRFFLEHIHHLAAGFVSCIFEWESQIANQGAREIAKSLTRDGRFQSYFSIGGPAWLHELIARDASGSI